MDTRTITAALYVFPLRPDGTYEEHGSPPQPEDLAWLTERLRSGDARLTPRPEGPPPYTHALRLTRSALPPTTSPALRVPDEFLVRVED